MADGYGRTWARSTVPINGDSPFIGADQIRGGLIIYPHATIDLYISLSGATATANVGDGMIKLKSVAAGNDLPATFLGNDCPVNAVRAWTSGAATITFDTRSAQRRD